MFDTPNGARFIGSISSLAQSFKKLTKEKEQKVETMPVDTAHFDMQAAIDRGWFIKQFCPIDNGDRLFVLMEK